MRQTTKRSLACLLAFALAVTALSLNRPAQVRADDSFDQPHMGQGYTKRAILEKWAELRPIGTGPAFEDNPSAASPYAPGVLADQTLINGINAWNFARWLAGLDGLTLDPAANADMAAGALINAANHNLSHYPAPPAGMDEDDALYKQGYAACGKSNLYLGYASVDIYNNPELLNMAVLAWLDDSDAANVRTLGHRRWMLFPQTTQTGFGAAYTATPYTPAGFAPGTFSTPAYVVAGQIIGLARDAARARNMVCWPSAGYFPHEFFEPYVNKGAGIITQQAWSVSLNPTVYGKDHTSDISVTITETGGGTETFTERSDSGEKIFLVDTEDYGTAFCIIFRPETLEPTDGKSFSVTISGLKNPDGQPMADITYEVKFFSLAEKAPDVTPTPTPTATATATPTFTPTPTPTATPLADYAIYYTDRDKTTLLFVPNGYSVTLPAKDKVGDYDFAGWMDRDGTTFTDGQTEAPDFLSGTITPTKVIELLAIYSKTEGGVTVYTASPLLRGDANVDGLVNAADAAAILRHLVRLEVLTNYGLGNALVSGGATLSAADAAKILRYLVRLEVSL